MEICMAQTKKLVPNHNNSDATAVENCRSYHEISKYYTTQDLYTKKCTCNILWCFCIQILRFGNNLELFNGIAVEPFIVEILK